MAQTGLSVFGESFSSPTAAAGAPTPSSAITGLSSRQPLFGSPSGGIAQDAIWQYDSTVGGIGIGTSSPQARFYAQPPVTGGNAFGWASTGGVHLGGINSSGHIGAGTTAPVVPVHAVATGAGGAGRFTGPGGGLTSNALLYVEATASFAVVAINVPAGQASAVQLQEGGVNRLSFETDLGTTRVRFNAGTSWGLSFHTNNSTLRLIDMSTAAEVVFGSSALVGFYGVAATTRGAAITTVVPAAVYTSDVGAQVNRLTEAMRLKGLIN